MSGFLFGKMPSHGDFVARGLAAEERDRLDQWLSAEAADARAALGEQYEERFDSAPPWRFAWDEENWTAGAMASSVDSVGRRFPLMVARRGLEQTQVEAAAEACEQAIYDAFEQAWTADELAGALDGAVESGDEAREEGWWTLGGEAFEPASLPGRHPGGLMRAILGKPAGATA